MHLTIRNKKLLASIALAASALAGISIAQTMSSPSTPSASAANSVPAYALYRMMFQHVASLESAASDLEAKGNNSGGADLRKYYENALKLTPPEAAQLKQSAAACNKQLAQQDTLAQKAIATAHASGIFTAPVASPGSAGQTPPATTAVLSQLTQLEQGRTAISNSCIQSLQSSLSATTFGKIDIYVRTIVASHATAGRPALAQPKAPLSASAATAGGNK